MLHLLALFVLLACVSRMQADRVEKELEDVIRRAISLDFSIYDRNEPYAITIINQDGYKICSGTIDRNQMKQVDCAYNKKHLKIGDNTFYITIYSKKNKAIIAETTTGFHYDGPHKYWVIDRVAEVARSARESLACTLMPSAECVETPRSLLTSNTSSPLMRAMGLGGMLTAGVYAAYVRPAILRSCVNVVRSVWNKVRSLLIPPLPHPPTLPLGTSDTDDDGSFPPPDAPPGPPGGGPSAGRSLQLDTPRSASRKTFRARWARAAGLVLGAALLSPSVIQPALRQVRTSFAHRGSVSIALPPQLAEALGRLRRTQGSTPHRGPLIPEPMVVIPAPPPPAPIAILTPAPTVAVIAAPRQPEAVRVVAPKKSGGPLQLFGRLGRALASILTGKGKAWGR